MKSLDKRVLAMGVGAGVGAITPTLLKNYVEPSQGQMIPGLDALQIWGTWHVFVPLVSGGVLLALTQFTNMIRNDTLNGALAMYGFAALFSAVVAGATETYVPSGARARATMGARPRAYVSPTQTVTRVNGAATPTSVSRAVIVS